MVHENPWYAGNPYIYTLIEGLWNLNPEIIVAWGRDLFWNDRIFSYDIVHFHWPQAFMNGDRHSETELRLHIEEMKRRGLKIVATCHDLEPHYDQCSQYRESMEIVYSHCDAIFHLGDYSKNLFEKKYPHIKHFILPHHIYDTVYTFRPSRDISLKHLGLSTKYTYILCFGTFRADVERELVINTYRQLKDLKIAVLAPGFMDITARRRSIKGILQRLKKEYYQYRYHIICSGRTWNSIPEEEVPYYYGAADVALIHRLKILNSGNAYLPLLFKKIVVGPDTGNVGSILKSWGLPVFDTKSLKSVGDALRRGLILSKEQFADNKYEQLTTLYSTKRIVKELYYILVG